MRAIYLLCLGILLFTLPGCKYFKSTHPQAGLPEEGTTGMTDKSILNFAAAIDRNLNDYKRQYSLIYQSGDLSVYAEKYSAHNDGMLYKTYTANGTISNTVKSYYFKNDSLILVKERIKLMNEEGGIYKDVRTYIRNNVTFKIDSRTASSAEALRTLPYLPVQAADNKYPEDNYVSDIKGINDAINGTDKFDMAFDNISTYPDALYIMLKSKKQPSYRASILVKNKDAYIDSLLNFPSLFKEGKLKFKWKIEDNLSIYVPVADSTTSASGLNK
ncbi:hypothetical protein TH53_06570 [Pedobacter lusitanus]|uniref:Uncharacterized protein n=1 Tax=Pedobacter lusitanus TaxID=1503925 RepID=A0A0D0FZI6_9SPHI|nr:hypothetical protein [Pedobacter lusitanus]KIO77954.1 hypothetical protein TH53_06570 [Pedobacter lusitanus]